MKLKFPGFIITLTILMAACAPAATPMSTASAVPVTATAAPSEVSSPVPATKAVSSPKQRDLLFVEFFAVT